MSDLAYEWFQIMLSQGPCFFDLLSLLHGKTVTEMWHVCWGWLSVTERKSQHENKSDPGPGLTLGLRGCSTSEPLRT